MERRPLGRTGLSVTPIGFGLAAVGRPGYITLGRDHDLGQDRSVEALERRAHEVLSAAYDAGIRYFDAARSYGFAERFLSSWLQQRGLSPNDVTVGSKWGYTYVGNWRVDANNAGWGVIIKEALANGRLADRDTQAIAAALAKPWADVVLSGAVTRDQMLSNVKAPQRRLAEHDLEAFEKLVEPRDQYWSERSQLHWS